MHPITESSTFDETAADALDPISMPALSSMRPTEESVSMKRFSPIVALASARLTTWHAILVRETQKMEAPQAFAGLAQNAPSTAAAMPWLSR